MKQFALLFLSIVLLSGVGDLRAESGPGRLLGRTHNSGFPEGHDTYNAMGAASDGCIYYVLSSESIDVGARMFAFDPRNSSIRCVGDLTAACGEKDLKAIPQGKSHVNFV
ncbi:MAG: hypothetical protein WCR20_17775, partial [Verrucomicrobiota bacterium]